MGLKLLDGLAVVLVLLVLFLSFFIIYNINDEGTSVHINTASSQFIYPLNSANEIQIKGLLGDSYVEIKEGQVRVTSAPCPLKICIHQGPISETGQWIACLPNGIMLRIISETKEEPEIDAFTE